MRRVRLNKFPSAILAIGVIIACAHGALAAVAPSVATRPAANITANSAQLQAVIVSEAPLTDYGFEYSEAGQVRRISLMSAGVPQSNNIAYELKNLKPETAYEAYAYAANQDGVSYGNAVKFTTIKAGEAPVLGKGEALAPEAGVYTLRVPFASEKPLLSYGVNYGSKKSSLKTKAECAVDGGILVAKIKDMPEGGLIYYQIRVENMYGVTQSAVLSITLPAPSPTPTPTPTPEATPTPTPAAAPEATPTPDVAQQPEPQETAAPEPGEITEAEPGAPEPEEKGALAELTLKAVHDVYFLPVTAAVTVNAQRLIRNEGEYDANTDVIDALAEMSRGNQKIALERMGNLLARRKDSLAALELAGVIYLRMQSPELAAQAFTLARVIAPEDGYVLAGLSLCALQGGDIQRAYTLALECEKLGAGDAALRIPRLLSVLSMRRYADLLLLAEGTLALFPNHAVALGARAGALKELGRSEAGSALEAIGALPDATSRDCYAKSAAYAIANDAVKASQWIRVTQTVDAKDLARSDSAFARVRGDVAMVIITQDFPKLFQYLLILDAGLLLLIGVIAVVGRPRRLHMWEVKK